MTWSFASQNPFSSASNLTCIIGEKRELPGFIWAIAMVPDAPMQRAKAAEVRYEIYNEASRHKGPLH
jgi:hypothetical protein